MTRTLLSEAKLSALRFAINAVAEIPGDLAELGVYEGGVAHLMATACPERTVHLFDTFAGIPATGDADDGHKPGEFAADESDVREYLADCPNVIFHIGLFPRTAMDGRFALVHLDADLYTSTRDGLEWFWPRLSVGGAIVLDDWHWHFCPGVDRAVDDFFWGRTDVSFVESAEHQLTVYKRP